LIWIHSSAIAAARHCRKAKTALRVVAADRPELIRVDTCCRPIALVILLSRHRGEVGKHLHLHCRFEPCPRSWPKIKSGGLPGLRAFRKSQLTAPRIAPRCGRERDFNFSLPALSIDQSGGIALGRGGAIVEVRRCLITREAWSARRRQTSSAVRGRERDPYLREQACWCGSLPKAAVREFLPPSRVPEMRRRTCWLTGHGIRPSQSRFIVVSPTRFEPALPP
jgi:hypothetical protein